MNYFSTDAKKRIIEEELGSLDKDHFYLSGDYYLIFTAVKNNESFLAYFFKCSNLKMGFITVNLDLMEFDKDWSLEVEN